jgi:hypothetical protein
MHGIEAGTQDFGRNVRRKETTRETKTVSRNIIPTWLREIEWDGTDWIHLAEDTEQCGALVNLQIPYNVGKLNN